ncbi:hypothetical protein [Actinomadura sp. 21ATH]|uniref:hypothetical protein n=1 Tax=Actinomadura sp. 21ATH TaxID=1735444 RepID=UPI0035C010AB
MAMPLPLRFRCETGRVLVDGDPGYEPLRDFLVRDLGGEPAAIARARVTAAGDDPFTPWQGLYRHHRLDCDGTVVRVRARARGIECEVPAAVFGACLKEYSDQVGLALHRRAMERGRHADPAPGKGAEPQAKPGAAVTMLGLGAATAPVWGWGLLQTSGATLAEAAGLAPHAGACAPPEAAGGAYWADIELRDHPTGRVWTGTKTFLPGRVDGVRVMTDVTTLLMSDAEFVPGIPGAWSGSIAGVPGHGYLDPNGVGRLPVDPPQIADAHQHFRTFFPVLTDAGAAAGPAEVCALAAGFLEYRPYVLAAFLLHDVQCHRHHLDVVRGVAPGWEHTGNACHLVRGVETVRLEHLWLDGRSCELPLEDFHRALDAYERLLG